MIVELFVTPANQQAAQIFMKVACLLKAVGFEVDKAAIRMPEGPLKAIGEFPLDVALHTDVLANITVAVVAE